MRRATSGGYGFRIAMICIIAIWLTGCGISAAMGAVASATSHAIAASSKAVRNAARATGRLVARPFRGGEDGVAAGN